MSTSACGAGRSTAREPAVVRPTAELACGSVLHFAHVGLLPRRNELVPCLRHQFCAVVAVSTGERRGRSTDRTAPTSRDLRDYLRGRGAVGFAELRHHRFTLRIVSRAAKSGLVIVDWEAGKAWLEQGTTDHEARHGARK